MRGMRKGILTIEFEDENVDMSLDELKTIKAMVKAYMTAREFTVTKINWRTVKPTTV